MELEFDLDINDWMKLQENHLTKSKQFNRSKLIATLIFPFMISLLIAIDIINNEFSIITAIIFGTASIIWIIFFPKKFKKRALKQTKKTIEEGDNSSILGEQKVILNENEIINIKIDSERKFKWSAIKRLEESDEHYFLYNSALSAVIIPKFKIRVDLSELDSFLKSKIKQPF